MRKTLLFLFIASFIITSFKLLEESDNSKQVIEYDEWRTPEYCGTSCHQSFYMQWRQATMSQAYTHDWDEIEYFKLAVPHARKDKKVEGVIADCNGCHSPLAYLAGDAPPPRPEEGSRANESVSCEVCHNISGIKGDTAYNFNYIMEPGDTKFAGRKGDKTSPNHKIVVKDFMRTAKFCGVCHNEKSPYGAWVKSTQLEWEEGPYSDEGVQCQDCHMPKAHTRTSKLGTTYPDARQHLFHGAHDPGKIRGTIEIRIQPDLKEAVPGDPVQFTAVLFNGKTGHKFPTGSVEDRIVWLHVEAEDADGNKYHLPVDKKGFDGEEYTIASDALAYQDMGIALDKPDFKGVRREDVPIGDRIFRKAYFDPQGRMTMQQWNTKSFGVDYRIGPRETKVETYTFNLPFEVAPGKMKVTATMYYRLLVKPVGEFLGVPESEYQKVFVNEHSTEIEILP